MHTNVPKLYPNPETSAKVIDYSIAKSDSLPDFLLKYQAWGVSQTAIPDYLISTFQAQTLTWFTRAFGSKRVLEIGVYIGFSTMVWANAIGPEGSVIGLELSEEYAGMARKAFQENGIRNIELKVGDAVKTLEALQVSEPFDLIFIDANKTAYPEYLQIILDRSAPNSPPEKRLLKGGGLIVADNVLRRGIMADATRNNPSYADEVDNYGEENNKVNMEGLETFNTMMKESSRIETVLLPVFDGLGLGRIVD